MRVAQRDGTAPAHRDVADEAHVRVGRRLQPVDPTHRQVLVRIIGTHLQSNGVDALSDQRGHVEFVPGVRAGDLVRTGHPLAVHIDVGRREHAAEVEIRACRGGLGILDGKIRPVPPGDGEVLRGDLLHVGGVEGIVLVRAVGEQRGEHGGARRRRVPALGVVAGGGDGLGGVEDLGRGLDRVSRERGRRPRGRCGPGDGCGGRGGGARRRGGGVRGEGQAQQQAGDGEWRDGAEGHGGYLSDGCGGISARWRDGAGGAIRLSSLEVKKPSYWVGQDAKDSYGSCQ